MRAVRTDEAIRPYAASDEPEVLGLIEASLHGGPTGRRTDAFLRWKHEANPFGTSLRLVAEHDGRIIGFRSFLRWRFVADGRTVSAVRAVDTATHPDHQGRGVFTRLTLAAVEMLRGEADLIFNTPNARSRPGYLKMGWLPVGTIPLSIRPARPWRFLRGAPEALRGRGAPSLPPPQCRLAPAGAALADGPAVEALLSAAGADARLATDRTLDYLRWRYADAPDLDYRAVALEDGGELVGLAIGRPRHRGPLAEFLLAEVLVRGGDRATARRLLRAVAGAGCDHVVAHLPAGTDLASAGLVAGYPPAPRLGIRLVARPLSAAADAALRLDNWRLSLGDLELF